MYNTILFPTDGSDGASVALDHAKNVAAQYDATLHVLFVAQTEIGPFGMEHTEHEGVEKSDMVGKEHDEQKTGMTYAKRREEQGETIVGEVAESVGEIAVETVVLHGNPYERILDYADASDADLIVMGTHGRTGVDHYLLGSVTEKIVRTSDTPVLTVRMND